MTAEKPPAANELGAPIHDLQGWTRAGETLHAEKAVFDVWYAAVRKANEDVHAQIARAQGLVINVDAVGSFISAKKTAENLNATADAIRQRLDESAEFMTALYEFSNQAYAKLYAQDAR